MANYLADTSALIKLYHSEPGSDYMEQLIGNLGNRIYIAPITLIEFESVLAIKQRTRQISAEEAEVSRSRLSGELKSEFVRGTASVRPGHLRSAGLLIRRFGVTHSLRAMDAIQVAIAAELYDEKRIHFFLTSDIRLFGVAKTLGIPSIDPAGRESSVALF